MRKKTKITIDPKYILMIILFFCVVIGIISYRFEDKMVPIRSVVENVIAPMQKGINTVGEKIAGQRKYFTTLQTEVKKNEQLKKKIDELSVENKQLRQNQYELDNFRKLYQVDEQYANLPKVAARIISSDPDNWSNTFIIDKGAKDGIKKNMNVMAGEGLVGIVIRVNNSYAKVRSIIDDDSEVYGTILDSSENCIVSGDLELMKNGYISVSGIDKNAEIEDGAEVVTSQLSYKFLPGIPIGYIRDLEKDTSNVTQTGHLTPIVDFSSINMVFVITEVKASNELEEILK